MNRARVLAGLRRLAPRPSHDRADEAQARGTLYPRPRIGIDVAPRESNTTLPGEGIASEPGSRSRAANGSPARAHAPSPVKPPPEATP